MNYGTKLKEIRTYDLNTQKNIAEILIIKEDTYRKYENQAKIIPLKHLNSFCNHFNVSIDYVLGLSNIKTYNNFNKEINMKFVAQQLKAFRKQNNLTQKDLANSLNYDRSTISKYEDEKSMISLDFLYKLCVKYKLSADYILGKIVL